MTNTDRSASLLSVPTEVPVSKSKQVTVNPNDPWPSAYRGSRYSVVDSSLHGTVLKWSHRGEIQAMRRVPDGLHDALNHVGKRDGYGSLRVTASKEVITKIPASNYNKVSKAEANNGFIPAYIGKIDGEFDFNDFSNNPSRLPSESDIRVWSGLPFNHGESWSVCVDDVLRWNWKEYRFESSFDHDELIKKYKRFRPEGGRIYVNEHGHIWGNVNRQTVPSDKKSQLLNAYQTWEDSADQASKRLVTRRVERMKSDDAPDGLLPVYLGHLSQFDQGVVPKPIVSDRGYFGDAANEYD